MGRYEISVAARKDPSFNRVFSEVSRQMESTTLATIGLQSAMNGLRIGSMVGIGAMAAMVVPTVLATSVVADFDSTLRKIASVGGKEFAGSLDIISDKINEMAISYGIASAELAEGFLEFAKAGFSMQEIMSGLYEDTVKLAILNKTDFATAAYIATASWTLFGDTVENSAQMMDMMQAAVSASLLDVEDLTALIENAGSVFSTTGSSFEDFVAVGAALRQAAYTSGATLSTLMANMITHESIFEDVLGDNGIIDNGVINFKRLGEVMSQLDESDAARILAGISESSVGGVRIYKPLAALIATAPQLLSIYDEIANSQGIVDAGVQGMTVSIENLRGQIEAALLAPLQDKEFLDELSVLLQGIKDMVMGAQLGEALRDIVRMSVAFISERGPQIILMVRDLLDLVKEFYSSLVIIADTFMKILGFVAKIPAPLLMVASALVLVSKVVPINMFMRWLESAKEFVSLQKMMIMNQQMLSASSLATATNMTNVATAAKAATVSMTASVATTQATLSAFLGASQTPMNLGTRGFGNPPYHPSILPPTSQWAKSGQMTLGGDWAAQGLMGESKGMLSNSLREGQLQTDFFIAKQSRLDSALIQSNKTMANYSKSILYGKEQQTLFGASIQNTTAMLNTSDPAMRNLIQTKRTMQQVDAGNIAQINLFGKGVFQSNIAFEHQGKLYKTNGAGALTYGSKLRLLNQTIIQTGVASQIAASVGMMAMMSGFMMFVTNKDVVVKAFAALAAILGVVTLYLISIHAFSGPPGWALLAAGVGAAVMTGLTMREQMRAAEREMQADLEDIGSAHGGRVMSTGLRYIHKDEYVVPKEHVASVNDQDQLFAKFIGRGGATTNNKNTSTINNDNRTINIYQVRQYELERALIASGY